MEVTAADFTLSPAGAFNYPPRPGIENHGLDYPEGLIGPEHSSPRRPDGPLSNRLGTRRGVQPRTFPA